MTKKIVFLIFAFIFINQCGYEPIYSSKNINFDIDKINTSGNLKTSKTLKKNIENFGNKTSQSKKIDLNIFTDVSKNITSKDKKGNPKTFSLVVTVKITVKNKKEQLVEKDFSQSSSYSNNNNKFDLKKYENSLLKNITEKISQDVLLYLQGLNI